MKAAAIIKKELQKAAIDKLRKKIQQLETYIIEIKYSETYRTISEIEDRNAYFA